MAGEVERPADMPVKSRVSWGADTPERLYCIEHGYCPIQYDDCEFFAADGKQACRSCSRRNAEDQRRWKAKRGSKLSGEVKTTLLALPPLARKRVVAFLRKKDGWPPRMRAAILARDKTCQLRLQWCSPEYPYMEVDHIDPDGDHSLENGRAACPNCHRQRHKEEV